MINLGRLMKGCALLVGALTVVSVFQVVALATPQGKETIASQKQPASTETLPELSPRDSLIAQTYLGHAAGQPDPDESLEALQGYLDGMSILNSGTGADKAVAHFEELTKAYPDSRHAWEGLALSLKQRYDASGNRTDLRRYADAFSKAIEIGLTHGRIPIVDTEAAAVGLGQLGDVAKLNDLFGRLVQQSPTNHVVLLDYARGLAAANDDSAETWFRKAIQVRPTGFYDPVVEYGEWLLDRKRDNDALSVLTLRPGEPERYVRFLRGVAYEHLGAADKAGEEYAAYRRLTAAHPGIDAVEPMPSRFSLPGSSLQRGVTFSSDVSIQSNCTGYENMAKTLECEAGGETTGGRRAVGWVLRNRVFVGSRGCVVFNNSGTALCDKYQSVITEPNQFNYTCGRTPSTSTYDMTWQVWYGEAPETSTGWCPGGGTQSSTCTGTCATSTDQGGLSTGDLQFYGTSSSCPAHHPYGSCTSSDGKLCSNGGSDNCFYWVP